VTRIPIIPTVIVAIAVAVMILLGFWQLERRDEKAQQLALYAANVDKPAMAFPALGPVADAAMFRPSSLICLRVVETMVMSGKAADGSSGFRYIARCSTGAEGPGALVVLGVGDKPDLKIGWTGGPVSGRITREPEKAGWIAHMLGKAPVPAPMLVSDRGLGALKTPAPPAMTDIPNNHLAYAAQWFFFALAAIVIYALALRHRLTQPKDIPGV
jgi:cytochrome oxidase assembly protein ShyY1